MRYLPLFFCRLFTIVLSACAFVHQNKTQESAEIHLNLEKNSEEEFTDLQKGISSDWIPKDYTGDMVVITEANSGDIIIQTGEQLLYKNEIYGFQILLGKERKGGKICKEDNRLEFFLSGESDEWGNLVQNPKQDNGSCRPLGYTHYATIEILRHEAYENLKQEFEQLQNDEWRDLPPYRTNDKYRFVFIQSAYGKILKLLIPDARCKDVTLHEGEQTWFETYSCTEIEHSELILSGFSSFDI